MVKAIFAVPRTAGNEEGYPNPLSVCNVVRFDFRIILTQGLNRQIRRMCGTLGFEVVSLKRIRILNIELKGMKPGTWRKVTQKEMEELEALLRGSAG